jgi:acyl-CoA synthetase (AMP-forming)/AMP-acid ligase II
MKAEAVLVLVNYRLAKREIIYIVNDAGAEIRFVGKDFHYVAQAILTELRGVKKVVAIDGGHSEWESLIAFKGQQAATDLQLKIASSDIALQIYSSGTTGRPKGVLTSHGNLLADRHRKELLELWRDTDVTLLCMPLCHIGGTGVALRCIYFDMRIILVEDFNAAAVIKAIPDYKITKVFFVPSMLHFLLETPGCREADFSLLDLIFYRAAAMPFELLTQVMKVFDFRFGTAFGMTETNGGVTYLSPEDHRGDRARQRLKSCAVPIGAQIRIVDERGEDVLPGTVGELPVLSSQVKPGYFGLPEETAKAFDNAGYFDEDGYLYISDRLKDMIVSGGLNIYPREIDEVLLAHPAVAKVAVIGVPDDRWREAVKAIVVKNSSRSTTAEELVAFAGERMGKYKVPKTVDFVDALPRNTAGKVLKRELRLPYLAIAIGSSDDESNSEQGAARNNAADLPTRDAREHRWRRENSHEL